MDASPSSANFKYSAFIAYSHKDERWAKWLQDALETYRLPSRLVGTQTASGVVPRRLAPIFRDRSELPSSSDLSRTINEALRQSANLIVICSPHAAASHYVDEEISSFRIFNNPERIFCLIVSGEPRAGDLAGHQVEECFAPALRLMAPIAADARPGKDGKLNAKLKLIAGILDIGFDALKQREHQRHIHRMIAVTAASLLAMLITTGLAIDAIIARKAAVTARDSAERRQKQAESLVEFMLGDLNDKLSRVQRLDILEATDNQAMKYFQSLPTTDVTDQALALRAKALEKIGSIRASQGKLPEALESYRAAAALTRELSQRSPGDSERFVAYANSFNWIGNVYWYQGDLDRSLKNFQQAINLLEETARAPHASELDFNLASARTNAGRILESRGEFEQAKVLYQRVQKTYQVLRDREPDSVRWQSELGFAYDNLGKVALEQGQLDQAIAAYREDQRIKAALAAQDPKNYDAREDLLIADAILGRTLALCGINDAAIRYASEAVGLAKELVAFDATHADWREDLAYYSQQLGGMLRQSGRLDEALPLEADAVRQLDELVASDRTNARWRRELALARVEAARGQMTRHDYPAAKRLIGAALDAIKAESVTTLNDVNLILLAADADIVAGQIAAKDEDASAAVAFWRQARDGIAPIARLGNDPNALAIQVSAWVLLDAPSDIGPALKSLARMGYRTRDFDALLTAKNIPYSANADIARHFINEGSQQTHQPP